jgi:hypothetical protein
MIGIRHSNTVSETYYQYLFLLNKISITDNIDFNEIKIQGLIKYELLMDNAKLLSMVASISDYICNTDIEYSSLKDEIVPKETVSEFFTRSCQLINQVTRGNTIIRSELSEKIWEITNLFPVDVLDRYQNVLWFAYSAAYDLQNDVLALLILMQLNPDITQWASSRKDSVEKLVALYSNNQGDIYFLWELWNRIKPIISSNSLYRKTQIDSRIYAEFYFYKNKFLNNQKIPFYYYQLLDQLYKMGKLNVEDEYYYYISILTRDFSTIIDNKIIEKISYQTRIDKNKIGEFLAFYLNNLFVINQKIWMNNYQNEHFLLEESEENNSLEWIKRNLILPGIFRNVSESSWYSVLEAYIRAFSNNLIFYNGEYYLQLPSGTRIDKESWIKGIEKTLLASKTKYLIFHQYTTELNYLTPISFEWILQLNPVYFWYFFYDNKNSIRTQLPDYYIVDAYRIIRANRHLFNLDYLIFYLDKMHSSSIANLMIQINTKKF